MATVSFYSALYCFIVLLLSARADANKRFVQGDQVDELSEIQNLKQQISLLQSIVSAGAVGSGCGGATFTRWGRTTCPQNTDSVYTGYAAGSYYTHPGGAANYICAPKDPNNGTKPSSYSNYLYGVEFKTNDFGTHSQNQNVPCVVCRTVLASTALMVPARSLCYAGWSAAYSGKLSAGYYGHAGPSEYICVDVAPEYVPGGHASQGGKFLYPVTTHCGSLPCPPYDDNLEIPCVICLK